MSVLAKPPLLSERPSDFSASNGVSPAIARAAPAAGTLILGLGNDILTDDAVGLFVARALRQRFSGNLEVEVVECCEMGLSLLDHIVGHEGLIVVDAVQTGRASAGHLHEVGEDGIKTLPGMSPHFLGVGEILKLGRLLELPMPTRVTLFAVEVEDPFTLGTSLTSAVNRCLPQIVHRIVGRVCESTASLP